MTGSELLKRIWEIIAGIPAGKVMTYGQVALLSGHPGAARAVVFAMRCAPEELNLPCHRVVSRTGRLAPDHAFGGSEIQRAMLESEGIPFAKDGLIDIKRCLGN